MTTTNCIDHGRTRSVTPRGYARVWHEKRVVNVHRVVYCKTHGLTLTDIHGLMVLHSCDNPRCINPDHLSLGMHVDNMRDLAVRRRHADLKLTEEQVIYIRKHCKPADRPGRGNTDPLSFKGLGRRFGVANTTIKAAYTRRTFKHLP